MTPKRVETVRGLLRSQYDLKSVWAQEFYSIIAYEVFTVKVAEVMDWKVEKKLGVVSLRAQVFAGVSSAKDITSAGMKFLDKYDNYSDEDGVADLGESTGDKSAAIVAQIKIELDG